MIPGSNLLNVALTVIAAQTVMYLRELSRALNDIGQDVTTYALPVEIKGSFQPVPRKLYAQYGLDFQKSYFTLYSSTNIIDVGRDVSGDKIVFNGRLFQCESNNDWYSEDGWKGVLCVDIGSSNNFQPVFGFDELKGLSGNQNFENGSFKL